MSEASADESDSGEEEEEEEEEEDVEDDADDEEDDDDEEGEEAQSDAGVPAGSDEAVENDIALLQEICETMDSTFARLLLRYPPPPRVTTRTASRGDTGAPPAPSCAGPFGDGMLPQAPSSGGGGGGTRTSQFRQTCNRMASLNGLARLSAPENERPPVAAKSSLALDHLAAEALSAFLRPDMADDEPYEYTESESNDLAWDAGNPEHVAEAIRALAWVDSDTNADERYLKTESALRRIDDALRAQSCVKLYANCPASAAATLS